MSVREDKLVSGQEEAEEEDDAALGEHHHVQLGQQWGHTRHNVKVQKQLEIFHAIDESGLPGMIPCPAS